MIQHSLNRVREKILNAHSLLFEIKSLGVGDRITAVANYERVNFWSLVNIIIFVLTGVIQVVVIRQLFIERSALRRLWKSAEM